MTPAITVENVLPYSGKRRMKTATLIRPEIQKKKEVKINISHVGLATCKIWRWIYVGVDTMS